MSKKLLLSTDRAFSALSKEKGMNYAFMKYLASDGVLLRSNSMLIVGKGVIRNLNSADDKTFTLTW